MASTRLFRTSIQAIQALQDHPDSTLPPRGLPHRARLDPLLFAPQQATAEMRVARIVSFRPTFPPQPRERSARCCLTLVPAVRIPPRPTRATPRQPLSHRADSMLLLPASRTQADTEMCPAVSPVQRSAIALPKISDEVFPITRSRGMPRYSSQARLIRMYRRSRTSFTMMVVGTFSITVLRKLCVRSSSFSARRDAVMLAQ